MPMPASGFNAVREVSKRQAHALRRMNSRARQLLAGTQRRSYHFASPAYVSSFGEFPPVDVKSLRSDTVKYLENFESKVWYDDPVCTLIRGQTVAKGETVDTVDAFGNINGKQILAPADVVDQVLEHVKTLKPGKDYRAEIRRIEARLLSEHAALLIGNQALDFYKQDGVTEIEESIEANVVERKLNDLLLADELAGRVKIQRHTALVGCVSNFSNFLDLCRKTLRNIELGVPVLVLSRSNTTQHMYRWVQLLLEEMKKEGLDTSLVSYVSCSIQEQRKIMPQMTQSPLYLTGSREVAAAIKELMPHTFASTGGPNTMVAPKLDNNIEAATRMSSTIENSGQCTAMRHLVTDSIQPEDLKRIFAEVQATDSSAESLRKGAFDGLFRQWAAGFKPKDGYEVLPSADGAQPLAYKISKGLTPKGVEEHWRRVYLDVSTPPPGGSVKDPSFLEDLSKWLTTEQPITLAVNGDEQDFPIMRKLFESTAQAIYSVGRDGKPALTAQARPQDGEIFGEFPPRAELQRFTSGPVFVPSSTPTYMARYEPQHLQDAAQRVDSLGGAGHILQALDEAELRGYAVLLAEYLKESCGAKHGFGNRTTLWGLQRPPLRAVSTLLRVRAEDDLAAVLLHLMPFLLTNAQEGLVISMATSCSSKTKQAIRNACQNTPCHEEEDDAFKQRCQTSEPWNTIYINQAAKVEELPLVDHFVLRLLPMGHIKSACQDDKDFVNTFENSPKWLKFTA